MASATITAPEIQATKAICNILAGLPLSVTWRIGAEANIAEIQVPKKRFHELRQYNAGKSIWIKAKKAGSTKLVFQGWLTGRYCEYAPESEMVTIIGQGARWKLGCDFLKGQYRLCKDGEYHNLTGLKTIFNAQEDRAPIAPGNAASELDVTTKVRPFSTDPLTAAACQAFTANEMLWYVYKIGKDGKSNIIGNPITLDKFGIGTLGELTPFAVDVDGLSIADAIDTIMAKAGLRWWCRPISESQSEIRAFLSGPVSDAPVKYLYLADVASGVAPSVGLSLSEISTANNTNAGRLHEDFAEIANNVYAYGDRKAYEAEFTLVPGWSAETWATLSVMGVETVHKELRESTSTNWSLYRDIGRKWILDEDGSVSGTAYDFSELFETEEYSQSKRPFLGYLPSTGMANFQAATVKHPVSGAYEKAELCIRLLEDQAGIYLEGDELPPPILVDEDPNSFSVGIIEIVEVPLGNVTPKLASELKFTAAVQCDAALETNTSEDDAQTRKQWLVGIQQNDTDEINRRLPLVFDSEYQTDNQNATKETFVEFCLETTADRKLQENQDPRVSASFTVPWITTSYEPGDIIAGIRGRDLYFTAQIIEVRLDFTSQVTELVLEDTRLAES